MTQITDWLNSSTTFKYDDNGRLTSIARPNGVTTTYTYDADGDVAKVSEDGKTTLSSIVFTRDARGLVTQADRKPPLSPSADQLATAQSFHTYDAAGQILEYQYDKMGRRTSDDSRTYAWDLASRLSSLTGASENATFTHNALGWLASQTKGGTKHHRKKILKLSTQTTSRES